MSRIGNTPVAIPSGVTVTIDGDLAIGLVVRAKGAKGELERKLTGGITATAEGNQLKFDRPDDEPQSNALHGLYRSLCAGMVEGVSNGFSKRLEVVGVSYNASVEGNKLRLMCGFSHPVLLAIPSGIAVACPNPTQIMVTGCDKQLVGEFAARVRRTRPPEPYKGKGVRYYGEHIVQKAGKSFVGGEK